MNNWIGIGNLTKDPDLRYNAQTQMAVCRFTIAIDRPSRDGEKKTDYPQITAFGKTAENCGKYLKIGSKVAVSGSVQTGSYTDREGKKVFTTGIVAGRVEFLTGRKEEHPVEGSQYPTPVPKQVSMFEEVDEELPF